MTYDFSNFHDATAALFSRCEIPARDPDFISRSGHFRFNRSMYWSENGGVIRLSDHWAGQNGCVSQRSCKWEFSEELPYGRAAAGFCAYENFTRRVKKPVWHLVGRKDRALAELLLANGGAIPASEWTSGSGRRTKKLPVPAWATEQYRGGICVRPAAARLFEQTLARIAIVPVNQRSPLKISRGAARIKTGERYV